MDKCYKHINKDAIRKCVKCGVGLCELCIEVEDGMILCKECLQSEVKSPEIKLVFDIDEKEEFDFSNAFDDIKRDFNIDKDSIDLEDIKVEHKSVDFNIEDEIEKRVREISKAGSYSQKSNSQNDSSKEKSNKHIKYDYKESLQREKENLKREINREKENLKKELQREKERVKREVEREINREKEKAYKNMNNDDFRKQDHSQRNGKALNSFLVFCFSLIPGAGHMYLEFMTRGMFLCIAFFGSCIVFRSPFVSIAVFIYSFFDAHRYKNKILRGEPVNDSIDDIIEMFKNPVFLIIILAIFLLGPLTAFLTSKIGIAILVILLIVFLSKRRR